MLEEVRKGVKKLKSRKAPGVWGALLKMIKAGEAVMKWLAILFNMVWRVGQ